MMRSVSYLTQANSYFLQFQIAILDCRGCDVSFQNVTSLLANNSIIVPANCWEFRHSHVSESRKNATFRIGYTQDSYDCQSGVQEVPISAIGRSIGFEEDWGCGRSYTIRQEDFDSDWRIAHKTQKEGILRALLAKYPFKTRLRKTCSAVYHRGQTLHRHFIRTIFFVALSPSVWRW